MGFGLCRSAGGLRLRVTGMTRPTQKNHGRSTTCLAKRSMRTFFSNSYSSQAVTFLSASHRMDYGALRDCWGISGGKVIGE